MLKNLFGKAGGILLLALSLLIAGRANAAKPEIDPTYADGQTYYMIGPTVNTSPSPGLFARAEELYLASYPWDFVNNVPPQFASDYQPQCNPCYHPGLPVPFVYHDHVITGAPGLGKDGTARTYLGPWKIIVMQYVDAVLSDPNFVPAKSETEIDLYETLGLFKAINPDPNAENPFEIVTGNVLICPLVSPHA